MTNANNPKTRLNFARSMLALSLGAILVGSGNPDLDAISQELVLSGKDKKNRNQTTKQRNIEANEKNQKKKSRRKR